MDKEIILKEAIMDDAQMLLEWRNDAQTKLASHNKDDVTEGEHITWISKIINDPNRKLYIAWFKVSVDSVMAVGTCRADYDEHEDIYELSWTVAPEARGRGTGKRMVAILANNLSDKNIRAEIQSENIGSIKIAEYAGMKLQDIDGDNVEYYSRKAIK